MAVILLAPGAFKGCLTASQAAHAMAEGARRVLPDAVLRLYPLADGGEGTLDAVLAATGGQRRSAIVTAAHGRPVTAAYGVLDAAGEQTALIEVAQVIGLTVPGMAEVAVEARTTEGVGALVRHALDHGVRRFLIGLGGSATNDGGAGLLAALGATLHDAAGQPLVPRLGALSRLAAIDFHGLDARLSDCTFTLLSDVTHPLTGAGGATAVFGAQKGVVAAAVAHYDARLRRFGELGDHWAGRALSMQPGAGAAGGLGYGFLLLGAAYRSGGEAICALTGFDAALRGADGVITGEGRSDIQTLGGKAPYVAGRRARQAGVPAILLSGAIDAAVLPRLRELFDDCYALTGPGISAARAMADARPLLALRAAAAMETWRLS